MEPAMKGSGIVGLSVPSRPGQRREKGEKSEKKD